MYNVYMLTTDYYNFEYLYYILIETLPLQSLHVCLAGVIIAGVKVGPRGQFAGTCTMRSVVEVSK